MPIKINTSSVSHSANIISSINKTMSSDFNTMEQSVKKLRNYWSGSGADVAMTKFQNLANMYESSRENVISDLSNFMLKQVGEAYETTESKISANAVLFK